MTGDNRLIMRSGTDTDLAFLRQAHPESLVVDGRPRRLWVDVPLLWVALFGVWPLADPGHAADSVTSVVDLVLHGGAVWVLIGRWKLERTK